MTSPTVRSHRARLLWAAACCALTACSGGYAAGFGPTAVGPQFSSPQTGGAHTASPTPTPSPSPSPSPSATTATATANTGITWIGRTQATNPQDPNEVGFSWAGVRFGVHFSGTELNVSMNDVPATFLGHTGNAYFDVIVDGQPGTAFSITPAQATYSVVSNLAPGQHTVWVSKRTEGMIGSVQFHGFDVGSGTLLSAPAKPQHRIEVLGASADNGYGDMATNCGGYVDAQQNQDIAWPQLTADAVGAEVSNLAYSGKGLVLNYDPINDPTLTMPVIFADADTNTAAAWNFSQWQADAVLIDLGGNDMTANGDVLPANFVSSFVTFLQTIYKNYPNTMIYLVNNATETGAGRAQLTTALQQVVTQTQQMGQNRVAYLEFTLYTGSTFGCDGHPSAALHQQIATQVAAQLKADLNF